ncbi:MAG: AraC family transcriptional regulator [Campylobacterota bacterium]|nr:AraC family transcriptional regulator [Campylobacterota bacterium]
MKNDYTLDKSTFFKDDRLPFVEARFSLNCGQHFNEHSHQTLSVGAVEQGVVSYLHAKNEYVLKPNELSVINPNIVHACNPKQSQSRTYHMIYVDVEWCKGIQQSLFDHVDKFIPVSTVQVMDKDLFEKYLKLNYLLLDEKAFDLEKEESLQMFFSELFLLYCDNSVKLEKSISCNTQRISKAKEYIKNNCRLNLTVKKISSEVGLSEFYFIKIFKQNVHLTPHAFLLNEKINLAKELLRAKNSILDVALEVGFSDQSHLNRVFKKHVAATPYEYQQSIIG